VQATGRSEQKQQTRERILDAARKAIRARGLARPSVGAVMGDAGLTVGGFYAHFGSKDALMLEALDELLAERRDFWFSHVPDGPLPERRAAAARAYLSRKHRDAAVEGCPLPAILAEIAQQGPEFRALIAHHIETAGAAMSARGDKDSRRTALADLSARVGALTIARALGATSLSDEILSATKGAIR
jgi:AcrR family transcriptional regulator